MDDNMPPPRKRPSRTLSVLTEDSSPSSCATKATGKKLKAKRNESGSSPLTTETVRDDEDANLIRSEVMAVSHALQDEVHSYCNKMKEKSTVVGLKAWCRKTTRQLSAMDSKIAREITCRRQQKHTAKELGKELKKIEDLQRQMKHLEEDQTAESEVRERDLKGETAASRFLNRIDSLRQEPTKK